MGGCLARWMHFRSITGGLLAAALALGAHPARALPGPELAPLPASLLNPRAALPDEVAVGQAADGRAVIALLSGDRVYVQRLAADGSAAAPLETPLQGDGVAFRQLSLAVGRNGHYAIGVQRGLEQDAQVFIRRYNPDGSRLLGQGEAETGPIPGTLEGGQTCQSNPVEAANSPAVAIDGNGNLAYSLTRTRYCSSGPGGALEPQRTALFYRYVPASGTAADPVLAFEQSPVTSAGARVISQVGSAVVLHDSGDALLAWNGHGAANALPRTQVRAASFGQFTGAAAILEADNSRNRSAPLLGAKDSGYVLSWRGEFSDPQTGTPRTRCYAQSLGLDAAAQSPLRTLVACEDRRALIVRADGRFELIGVPIPGQDPGWVGRRYDAAGLETGAYGGGVRPNRYLDQAPRAWAPTLAGGNYLALYNLRHSDDSESLLQPLRYGGPDGTPQLNLELSPASTLTVDDGRTVSLHWRSNAPPDSCFGFGELGGRFASSGNRVLGSFTTAGQRRYGLACGDGALTQSIVLNVIDNGPPTVTAAWSPPAILAGQSSTLTYSSQNAERCEIALSGEFNTAGDEEPAGSVTLNFTRPGEQRFTARCTGPGGVAEASAVLTITAPVPTVAAAWSPSAILVGQSSTLTYSSQNAERCEIALVGEFNTGGDEEPAGSVTLSFTRPGEQRFTARCRGPGGVAEATAVLTVTAPVPTLTVAWSPAQIRIGESSTLTYSSQNAEYCDIRLSGEFELSGREAPAGSVTLNFSQPGEQVFNLVCTGPGGEARGTARLTVTAPAPTVSAQWTPAQILIGQSSTLSYSSQNAEGCQITLSGEFNTAGDEEPAGSVTLSFTRPGEQRFTARCSGPGGVTEATAVLAIAALPPTVTAVWSPASVVVGQMVSLGYQAQNAQSCTGTLTGEIEQDAPLATAGGFDFTFLRPGDQVFTYRCTGPGGSAETTVTLSVRPAQPPPDAPVNLTLPDGRTVQVETRQGRLGNVRTMAAPSALPPGLTPLTAFIGFDISGLSPGERAEVTLRLPVGSAPTAFIKCVPQCVPYGPALFERNTVRLTLIDGGAGDADGRADGVIRDPGAPAVATPLSLQAEDSGGGSLGLSLLLGLLAMRWRRGLSRA